MLYKLISETEHKRSSYWTKRRRAVSVVQSWVVDLRTQALEEGIPLSCAEELSLINTEKPDRQILLTAADHSSSSSELLRSTSEAVNPGTFDEQVLDIWTRMEDVLYNYDDADGKVTHEYSDSDGDSCDETENESLCGMLVTWAQTEKVKNCTIDKLLKILHPCHPEIPLTARTLLKTGSNSFQIRQVSGGEYVHFGILRGFKCLENDIKTRANDTTVELQVNVDGLPLFKSSVVQLWPILGRVVGLKHPFIIGAFCGSSKPKDVEEFFSDFVSEALSLSDDGFVIQGVRFRVKIQCFICDAPARAFIKQTKCHTGYHSCDRCVQKGEYVQSRVVLPKVDAEKRTDEKFAKLEYSDHQINKSPLTDLNFGLVSGCVLDYMHLVCLGIVRRMMFFWLKGPLKLRLSSRHVNIISHKLVSLRGYIPLEFARKPRALSDLERWSIQSETSSIHS